MAQKGGGGYIAAFPAKRIYKPVGFAGRELTVLYVRTCCSTVDSLNGFINKCAGIRSSTTAFVCDVCQTLACSPLTADGAGSGKGQRQPKVPRRDSYPDCQRQGPRVQRRLRVQVRQRLSEDTIVDINRYMFTIELVLFSVRGVISFQTA